MRPQNPQQQRGKVIHVHHFQALILARVQRRAPYTSSPIINSQAAKLINSYIVIWTAISQLVLHNSGALLHHSLCQKPAQCAAAGLHCTALHCNACTESQLCNGGLSCSRACSMQATFDFKQQPRMQCFQYFQYMTAKGKQINICFSSQPTSDSCPSNSSVLLVVHRYRERQNAINTPPPLSP